MKHVDALIFLGGCAFLINMVGYMFISMDKSFAQRRMRRIPEATLLTLAALGGGLGVAIGQKVERHKTRKEPFRTIMRVILSVHLLLVICVVLYLTGGI